MISLAEPSSSAELKDTTSIKVAVASNFAATAKLLIDEYQRANSKNGAQGDVSLDVSLIVASTGKLTAQIQYGLSVDLFLAADQLSPKRLEKGGFALDGSQFSYAQGRLALWSAEPSLIDREGQVLDQGHFNHLAIANPKLAPYGRAAIELFNRKGIAKELSPKLVKGDSVGQAFQFVASGNAELGLLAYSQVLQLHKGSYWLVPNDSHKPILQTGVIVQDSLAVRSFVKFLRSEAALSLIEQQGYIRP